MNSSELAKMIIDALSDGYDDEESREETEIALYNELSQLRGDSFIRAALQRLCERVEELETVVEDENIKNVHAPFMVMRTDFQGNTCARYFANLDQAHNFMMDDLAEMKRYVDIHRPFICMDDYYDYFAAGYFATLWTKNNRMTWSIIRIVKEVDPTWELNDKEIAKQYIRNYGVIFLNGHGDIINNERELEKIYKEYCKRVS